ncbi:MAG: ImmA/IrrE family metallo-endopeptidase [Clostridia bacterium]|nr:ImmA/IrrE family metallo-endopeptidase [Clostridia bacterium]
MTEKVFSLAKNLIDACGTRNPREICRELNISVVFTDLPESIDGFYMESGERQAVIVKNGMDPIKSDFCLAHELGHALMHKGINNFFISENTNMPLGRFEREADLFAAALLIDISDPDFIADSQKIGEAFGVPQYILDVYFSEICKTN